MSAHADDGIPGHVQADVALELLRGLVVASVAVVFARFGICCRRRRRALGLLVAAAAALDVFLVVREDEAAVTVGAISRQPKTHGEETKL